MNTTTRDTLDQDPRRIEREIDQKRDHIGDLVSALESRLSPGDLFERVLDVGKGNGGEFARNLSDVVKANPVPALLVSAGLVWLYASRNDTPAVRTASHAVGTYAVHDQDRLGGAGGAGGAAGGAAAASRDAVAGLREKASHLGQDARETWHDVSARVGDGVHGARDSLQQGAQRARGGFEHLLQDNPMAVGAMAIAVGALLGAVVPTTEQENRLMGELGDKVTGKARSLASTVYAKGTETATELADQVKSAANAGAEGRPASSDQGNTEHREV